jgi:long-chain acyl-CoA synthetase
MKTADPLLAAWQETLGRKGDAPAIFETSGATLRSFRQIEEQAGAYQTALSMFHPGSVVGIQIGNHAGWPSILIACMRRNLVALPLETSLTEQERDTALKVCCGSGLIASSPVALLSNVSRGERWSFLSLGEGKDEGVNDTSTVGTFLYRIDNRPSPDWSANPPTLLKLTSGTTALPRAVQFRSAQLLADCDNICDTMGITDADVNFAVIPVSHSYGFSNLLTPLIARGVSMVLSGDRVPRAVLGDLVRTRATVFPGMPLFYQAFCEVDERPSLPTLRLCISAAAPLTAATAEKFHRQFNRPIHSFYGSSECGGICYDREGAPAEDGFVGTPMNNVEITLVEPGAESTPIQVRSAAVGEGYFPEPDEQKLGGGVFAPDDLLARQGSGFKIVGRMSDVINVAGKKVNPAEIEAQLMQFKGVREAIVFGRKSSLRNEEVAACVVAAANIDESDLLAFCRNRLSAWQVPKQIFLLDRIPISERGKTSRRQLAAKFANT